ncbi:hypothetical protein P261_00505 [Lachnospiraceae bacterium TWA4]|nr:hypothetical protein P261_00505 [Lachnospiraceae bacterium TWA4]
MEKAELERKIAELEGAVAELEESKRRLEELPEELLKTKEEIKKKLLTKKDLTEKEALHLLGKISSINDCLCHDIFDFHSGAEEVLAYVEENFDDKKRKYSIDYEKVIDKGVSIRKLARERGKGDRRAFNKKTNGKYLWNEEKLELASKLAKKPMTYFLENPSDANLLFRIRSADLNKSLSRENMGCIIMELSNYFEFNRLKNNIDNQYTDFLKDKNYKLGYERKFVGIVKSSFTLFEISFTDGLMPYYKITNMILNKDDKKYIIPLEEFHKKQEQFLNSISFDEFEVK